MRGSEVLLARGYEAELARILARRLGAHVDRFVALRPALRLMAGAPSGWHLALAGIEPSRAAAGSTSTR